MHAQMKIGAERLKTTVKRIPGGYWTARWLLHGNKHIFTRAEGPGDWLYRHRVVSWLYNESLNRQLPATFRLFARYCYLQRHWQARIIGGERALKATILVNRLLRLKDYINLDLGNTKVCLDLRDPRMLQVPNELLDANSDTQVLKSFLSVGDTFVDVGANHGSFSLAAAKLVGPSGLVVAFEPQPRLAWLLQKSLEANALCNHQVHSIACGDLNGSVDLYIPSGTSGSAGLFPRFSATAAHRRLSVAIKRFDDAVGWQAFPGKIFIKVDVEGSELAFLRGASAMIRIRKPHIMFEINPLSMNAAGIAGDTIVHCLQGLGYKYFLELQEPAMRRSLENLDASRLRNVLAVPPE